MTGGRVIPPFCFLASGFAVGGLVRSSVVALLFSSVALSCAQAQSEICGQYVACQQAYDAASQTGPADVAQYESDGICWLSDANADTCDQQCTEGVAALREAAANANLSVPACE